MEECTVWDNEAQVSNVWTLKRSIGVTGLREAQDKQRGAGCDRQAASGHGEDGRGAGCWGESCLGCGTEGGEWGGGGGGGEEREGGGVCFARQKNYVYRIQLQVGIPLVSHVFVIIFVPIDTNDNWLIDCNSKYFSYICIQIFEHRHACSSLYLGSLVIAHQKNS